MIDAAPLETDDDVYLGPGESYRMMRLARGNRAPKRCRLRPVSGPGHNPKWAYVFNLIDDFDRAGGRVPQSVTLVTNVGTFRIEGHGLDAPGGLYDMLDEERVREVVAYCAKRHGARGNGPYVSRIVEVDPEGAKSPVLTSLPDDREETEDFRAA